MCTCSAASSQQATAVPAAAYTPYAVWAGNQFASSTAPVAQAPTPSPSPSPSPYGYYAAAAAPSATPAATASYVVMCTRRGPGCAILNIFVIVLVVECMAAPHRISCSINMPLTMHSNRSSRPLIPVQHMAVSITRAYMHSHGTNSSSSSIISRICRDPKHQQLSRTAHIPQAITAPHR